MDTPVLYRQFKALLRRDRIRSALLAATLSLTLVSCAGLPRAFQHDSASYRDFKVASGSESLRPHSVDLETLWIEVGYIGPFAGEVATIVFGRVRQAFPRLRSEQSVYQLRVFIRQADQRFVGVATPQPGGGFKYTELPEPLYIDVYLINPKAKLITPLRENILIGHYAVGERGAAARAAGDAGMRVNDVLDTVVRQR